MSGENVSYNSSGPPPEWVGMLYIYPLAPMSFAGMMDTVLNLGLNDKTVEALAKKSGDRRFAFDSYRRFVQMYSDVVLGIEINHFEKHLERAKEKRGVKQDMALIRWETSAHSGSQHFHRCSMFSDMLIWVGQKICLPQDSILSNCIVFATIIGALPFSPIGRTASCCPKTWKNWLSPTRAWSSLSLVRSWVEHGGRLDIVFKQVDDSIQLVCLAEWMHDIVGGVEYERVFWRLKNQSNQYVFIQTHCSQCLSLVRSSLKIQRHSFGEPLALFTIPG